MCLQKTSLLFLMAVLISSGHKIPDLILSGKYVTFHGDLCGKEVYFLHFLFYINSFYSTAINKGKNKEI